MLARLHPRVTYANVAATAALVLAGTGFAAAAIPGPKGVIHGCYKKGSGRLRVVSAGQSCRRSEHPLAWNQRGVPGAPGRPANASLFYTKSQSNARFLGIRATAVNATHAVRASNADAATNATKSGSAGALTGVVILHGPTTTNTAGAQNSAQVNCPSGMQAISGGVTTGGGIEQSISSEHITDAGGGTNNAFIAFVNNAGGSAATFHVSVVCIHGSVAGSS